MSFKRLFSPLFEYDTPKIVTVKSKKIGLLSRCFQLCILAYIIGFVMIYNKGYQEQGDIESDVTTKVKGISVTNFSKDQFQPQVPLDHQHLYNRVWDVTEYVVPPSENEAFFVTTNVVITPNQTLGVCDEDPTVTAAVCNSGGNCVPGMVFPLGSGAATGKCVNSTQSPGTMVCEVIAWCPVEIDAFPLKDDKAVLSSAENYTVLIKNSISFPHFGEQFKRNNILRASNATYLQGCIYDAANPFCPIFRLGDIVSSAGYNFSDMALKGGVISIVITWNCDLDWDFLQYCRPKYSFQRLDNPEALISPGWNFRHAYHHEESRRTLFKAYGIKFVIDVQGQARKFNLIPTMLNIGAGLALMSLTTICCDVVLIYLSGNRHYYKGTKYEAVEVDDAFGMRRTEYQNIVDNETHAAEPF